MTAKVKNARTGSKYYMTLLVVVFVIASLYSTCLSYDDAFLMTSHSSSDIILIHSISVVLGFITMALVIWLGFSTVRRLHDVGKSGWWLLVILIVSILYEAVGLGVIIGPEKLLKEEFIGLFTAPIWAVVAFIGMLPAQVGDNKYGSYKGVEIAITKSKKRTAIYVALAVGMMFFWASAATKYIKISDIQSRFNEYNKMNGTNLNFSHAVMHY